MRVGFKKKKKKQKRSDSDLSTPREREIRRDRGHGVDGDCLWSSPTRRSARSSTGDYLWVSTFTVSNSKLSPTTVKICDFLLLLFFFTIGMLDTSEPCRHLSEKRKKKEKKKKKDTRRHRNPTSRIRSGIRHWHNAKNGVSVQPRLLLSL